MRSSVVALFSSVCSAVRLHHCHRHRRRRHRCPVLPLSLSSLVAFSLSHDMLPPASQPASHRRHYHHRRGCRRRRRSRRCFCRRFLRYGYVLSLSPPRDYPLIPTPSLEHLSYQGVQRVRGARWR